VLGYSQLLWLKFFARQNLQTLFAGLESAFICFNSKDRLGTIIWHAVDSGTFATTLGRRGRRIKKCGLLACLDADGAAHRRSIAMLLRRRRTIPASRPSALRINWADAGTAAGKR
jgi:hypothetical protein